MAKSRPLYELVIPPAALRDKRAIEMMRVWIADAGLHCSLNIGHWEKNTNIDEDQAWGMVFADAIRHVANALHEMQGIEPTETVRRLFKTLEVELNSPTSNHRGSFVDKSQTSDDGRRS